MKRQWRNAQLARESDEEIFLPALGCAVEKIGIDFAHHSATLFLPRGAKPNPDRARAFFRIIDGLVGRIVVVNESGTVTTLWQEYAPPKRERRRSASTGGANHDACTTQSN